MKWGKDVGFITAFYNRNPVVVAPMPYGVDYSSRIPSYSADENAVDASMVCKAQGENLRLPDRDEIASLFVNAPLINLSESTYTFWSGSIISTGSDGLAWTQYFGTGDRNRVKRSETTYVRCVIK